MEQVIKVLNRYRFRLIWVFDSWNLAYPVDVSDAARLALRE